MFKKAALGVVILSLLLGSLAAVSSAYVSTVCKERGPPAPLPRTSPLNITVVFIGFDQQCINTTYMTWLLPQSKPEIAISSNNNWGVNYTLTYSYVFTNQSFRANLESYLSSINQTIPAGIIPPGTNPYLAPIPPPTANIFYDANQVEQYLYSRLTSINAIPARGYAAVIMNLSRPWNFVNPPPPAPPNPINFFPHYYNATYYDKDIGKMWYGGQMYGQWMLGWGGHYRFWFMDLSAGAYPNSNNPYWQYGFYPIWYLGWQYSGGSGIPAQIGVNFLTHYVSDFIKGIVNDHFAPDLQFDLRPSERYDVVIYALDNSTGLLNQTVPLINTTLIQASLSNLIPHATWTVNITYVRLNGTGDPPPYNKLWTAIKNADLSFTGGAYIDFYAMWNFFDNNMGSFVTLRPDRVTIPVFVLQFKGSYQFTWLVNGVPQGSFPGLSVYNLTLIGRETTNQWGVTHTVIHEVGHIMGLVHPFLYDSLQDFTASPMSYYIHEYSFSQFEKYVLSRSHVDYYMIRAANFIDNATDTLRGKVTNSTVLNYLNWAEGNATAAQQLYDVMNYTGAIPSARTAEANAIIAAQMAQQLPQTPSAPTDNASEIRLYQTLVIGLLGLTLFLVLVVYVIRRGKRGKAGKS